MLVYNGENKKEDGKKGEEENAKKEAPPPPPPHGDKTPWQVFRDTFRSELQASKEWNESTKALASSAHDLAESERIRKARAAYEAASSAASTKTSAALKKTGSAIGKGAAWTWETPVVKGIRTGVSATGRGLDMATKPVRETEAYKKTVSNVKEVMDDGASTRYGGWIEKEERRKQRALREAKEGRSKVEVIQEDPNAGTNITLHKDARWKEQWRDFRDKSKLMQHYFDLKNTYQESENPLISTARSVSDAITGFFAENETAQVIKKFRQMDPTFQMEPFLRDLREYILPEVLDAYVKGDGKTLKLWLSEAQYYVYEALSRQYTTAGLEVRRQNLGYPTR
ncbi:TIM23 translocase complex subunit Tim44 [Ascosphaera apis ARSEF 7405]|uniref:TIM23 translocase complex subunit Tim44 n=1 Tax=Ascosphaera apis ARSEF 7405 TaxID=392613 RepID=A0A167ZGT7_9EURO|nr:TIM23 translocase complex subunit Tim44 [Ascosphaera apis ARSEF 7405]